MKRPPKSTRAETAKRLKLDSIEAAVAAVPLAPLRFEQNVSTSEPVPKFVPRADGAKERPQRAHPRRDRVRSTPHGQGPAALAGE